MPQIDSLPKVDEEVLTWTTAPYMCVISTIRVCNIYPYVAPVRGSAINRYVHVCMYMLKDYSDDDQ